MKKVGVFIIALGFLGCGKDNTIQQSEVWLHGNWQWYLSQSIFYIRTPQSTGKTWKLTFNADLTCSQAGTLYPVSSGSYFFNTSTLYITFPYSGLRDYVFYFKSRDTLVMDDHSYIDGPINYFVRVP